MDAPRISAKNGVNIHEVMERIVTDFPAPQGDPEAPLQALIFDSVYDSYRGVIVYLRVMQGTLRTGMTVRLMSTGAQFDRGGMRRDGCHQSGSAAADRRRRGRLFHRQHQNRCRYPCRRYRHRCRKPRCRTACPATAASIPMVFCGIYPADGAKYPDLREALEKLQLNDAALSYEPETSAALGFGFRCGFLGLLHMEIIEERLEREFDLDLITTAPSVIYQVTLTDGTRGCH